jgi:RNA polymerase sigma-70 factor (ECF subfamily)
LNSREKTFLELIEKHKGMIHKVSKVYMEDPEDRQDLFQEILLQLWKSFDSFKGESQFSTWMYRVSLNTAITFLKKEKRKVDNQALTPNLDRAYEEHNPEKESQLEHFYRAVNSLNAIEKALIFLFLEDLPHRDIAQNLGISEVNARVKLNRTKEKLQNIIKQQGYEF